MKTDEEMGFAYVKRIGVVRSTLKRVEDCPLQGDEGAPEAWLHIEQTFGEALSGLSVGNTVLLLTWFHLANRQTLMCYPRNEVNSPHVGVFTTRSPNRPNPIGLHRVTIIAIDELKLKVSPLEAVDGTIVLDIKPELSQAEI